ncbi:MAG: sensor histidine kinase, partial [Ruoffia tabacinasalis]
TYLNNSLDLVEEENLSDIRVRKPVSEDEWSDLSLHVNKLLDKIDKYVTNQKQFVEDVSHELRTPVAIVEGHLKLLNRWGKDDPEVLEESIASSLQEITRMKGLVQEMLDLSRAENVDIDYKDEITEVYSTTEQVFNNFKIIHEDFDFYLDSDDDGESLYIQAFRNHIEQVLIILLDNAVKYSRDRKEIHVSISKSFTKVEIAIQDFGEGMTDEDKEKVFGRFYRIDKARSRDKGGNGLGLSIAKQLVEGYKGAIRVESVINHGSIFYIEFPILNDTRQIYKSKQIAERKKL